MSKPAAPVADRFWMKVDRKSPAECWEWLGSRNIGTKKYGQFYVSSDRRGAYAHRFAYELTVGPIPDGMQIDHLCRNTFCVNPLHLEAVPQRVNIERQFAALTVCRNGHPRTDVRIDSDGQRRCVECRRVDRRGAQRRYRAKRKAAA